MRRLLKDTVKAILPPGMKDKLARRSGLRPKMIRSAAGSLLSTLPDYRGPDAAFDSAFAKINDRVIATAEKGALPLWEGYAGLEGYQASTGAGATRTVASVSSKAEIGRFFTWLATKRSPDCIVEFGTAFGVSGMYWMAALTHANQGMLYTFDPNEIWATLARENIAAIGDRFVSTIGTFEDNVVILRDGPRRVDLCFIDAIHTSEFVFRQLDLVMDLAGPGTIILFDDINFSDDMQHCWKEVAARKAFSGAAEFGHVGIVEVA